jgi:hypothetical protein
MVMGSLSLGVYGAASFAARAGDDVLNRLDPPRRAAVVMALLGLTLVGLFLVAFAMVGGHWVRRLARHRPGQRTFGKPVTAEAASLREALEGILPEVKSSDTVLLDSSSKDTRAD